MRRTEFELCHGEKGYHEMKRFALDFPADCPGEAFLFPDFVTQKTRIL